MDTLELRLQTEAEKSEPALAQVQHEVETLRNGNKKETMRIESGLSELDNRMRKLEVAGSTTTSDTVLNEILGRVQQRENKPLHDTVPTQSAWFTMHIAIGGWKDINRDIIGHQCESIMRALPVDIRGLIQRPFAPRPVASIAKARGRRGELAKAQFML